MTSITILYRIFESESQSVSSIHFRNKEPVGETSTANSQEADSGSPTRTNQQQNSKDMQGVDEADASTTVAPRVKLDADGNIIVDEERCQPTVTFLCFLKLKNTTVDLRTLSAVPNCKSFGLSVAVSEILKFNK